MSDDDLCKCAICGQKYKSSSSLAGHVEIFGYYANVCKPCVKILKAYDLEHFLKDGTLGDLQE